MMTEHTITGFQHRQRHRYYWYFVILLWTAFYFSQISHGTGFMGFIDAASMSLLLIATFLAASLINRRFSAVILVLLVLFNLMLVIGNLYYLDIYQSFAPLSILSLAPESLSLIAALKFREIILAILIILTTTSITYLMVRHIALPKRRSLSVALIVVSGTAMMLQVYHDQREFKYFSASSEAPLGYFLRSAGLIPFIIGSPFGERMASIDAYANGINRGITNQLPQAYLSAVKRFFPDKDYTDNLYPLLSSPKKSSTGQKVTKIDSSKNAPKNVIVIVLESFRASESGMYGNGLSATPFLDSLSSKALWARKFYANAPRTAKSETAINCGVLDYFGGLSLSERAANFRLSCIPDILSKAGYETLWFHGNNKDFYKRADHLPKQGFTKTYGIEDLYGPEYEENRPSDTSPASASKPILGWGIPDPILFNMALSQLENLSKPFYAEILSVSNHFPFNYEWGIPFPQYLQVQDSPYNKYRRGLYYSDQALKTFIEKFDNSPLYKNTVVLVTGDHGFWVFDENNTLSNINKYEQFFRVPLLIYGKDIPAGIVEQAASHVDIPPTVLSILGINTTTAFLGRSLMTHSPVSSPTFSLLDNSYGFRLNNKVCTPNRCYRNQTNSCSRDEEQQQGWRQETNLSCYVETSNLMFDSVPQKTVIETDTMNQIDDLLNYLTLGLKIGITPK